MSPDLSEVETFKNYVDTTSLNQKIENIIVRDNRVLNTQESSFKKKLILNTFSSTLRHGKYLLVRLNSGYIVFHFGMSGDLKYFKVIEDEPTHSRILFGFIGGCFLSYISMRMFGRVYITENVEDFVKERKLGPDAYLMNFGEFKEALHRRTAIAKSALMNQSIIAGIGNIYSDEILFHAKIHPKTKVNEIPESKLRDIFESIKEVLKVGIEKGGVLDTYPDDFIIPHRKQDDPCPHCNGKIQRYEVSQRHGFFCPNCQIQYSINSDEK